MEELIEVMKKAKEYCQKQDECEGCKYAKFCFEYMLICDFEPDELEGRND